MNDFKPEYINVPLAHQYPRFAKPHRGLAIAALVLGVVGVVFGLVPLTYVIALGSGALALIFGIIGRHHGMGKAGVILGTIAVALGIWGMVIVNRTIDDVTNNIDTYSSCINSATTIEEMDAC